MEPRRYDIIISPDDPTTICDALANRTGLSKSRIKQAMAKGAVWSQHNKSRLRRTRRATAQVKPGDRIKLYYDEAILSVKPPTAQNIKDHSHYGVWFKPAGLLVQGTRFGDHCTLLRQVEQNFKIKRQVYPIHRIDREASGLVIVGYSSKAAALFSSLFQKGGIEKRYKAWIAGELPITTKDNHIDFELDGKKALTWFQVVRYDPETHQSLVDVRIHTGRYHQIRRHFHMIGHPLMGDPNYGENNKNTGGLQLIAYELAFECPFNKKKMKISIDPNNYLRT